MRMAIQCGVSYYAIGSRVYLLNTYFFPHTEYFLNARMLSKFLDCFSSPSESTFQKQE
jgi:hypothetical protein